MAFDSADWRRRLCELLKEHPDIGIKATGMFEANLSEGGITKAYLNKNIRNASEFERMKNKTEKITARIIIG